MSLLSELNTLLMPILPVETGVFSGVPPDRYAVITPMSDSFELHADNLPGCEVQSARISIFDKGNYLALKNRITRAVMNAGITITARRYIGREDNTGYNHYAIDVANIYELEE